MGNNTIESLDHIRLNFSPESLFMLNIALAIIMFGVALEIKLYHFKNIIKDPKSVIIGFFSQFVALPFITFLMTVLFRDYLTPTLALGMILVAACPGGNISNFISSLARGNVALSVSLTAIATVGAVFFTPFNFSIWGSWFIDIYSTTGTHTLIRPLQIDTLQMFKTVFLILGLPLMVGIFVNTKFPGFTSKIVKPIKRLSIVIFIGIVILALSNNLDHFLQAVRFVFFIVLIQNAVAFATGYGLGSLFKRPIVDRKTISIETGIQNSGLALVLIFNPKIFPPEMELGGMAIIAAWWGIWHIIAGLAIAGYWSKFSVSLSPKQTKNESI
jgi:BASS family bile acid:Na+ symporter